MRHVLPLVFAVLLLASQGSARAQPWPGDAPDFPLTPAAVAPAPGPQGRPLIAVAGSRALLVWQDGRGGSPLYGVRWDSATREPLDPVGLPLISHAAAAPLLPMGPVAVAGGESDFLVVWSQDTLRAVRVRGSDGAVLDAEPVALASTRALDLAVSYGDGMYLVVWVDEARSGVRSIVRCVRVPAAGPPLDLTPITVADPTGASAPTGPSVTFDGTNFVVGWSDYRETVGMPGYLSDDPRNVTGLYTARIAPASGMLLDGPAGTGGVRVAPAQLGTRQEHGELVFGGGQLVAVWEESDATTGFTTFGARVDPVTRRAADGLPAAPLLSAAYMGSLSHDDEFTVWARAKGNPGIVLRHVSATDLSGSTEQVAISPGLSSPSDVDVYESAVNFVGQRVLVAYVEHIKPVVFEPSTDPDSKRLMLLNFDEATLASGTALRGTAVAFNRGTETNPSVAVGETTALAVWQDRKLNGKDPALFGTRLDRTTGEVLDREPVAIAIPPQGFEAAEPVVAYEQGHYLVAWVERATGYYSKVYGRRLREDGSLLDGPANSPGIPIADVETEQHESGSLRIDRRKICVAGDSGHFLAVWEQQGISAQTTLLARRIRAEDGQVLDRENGHGIQLGAADGWHFDVTGGDEGFTISALPWSNEYTADHAYDLSAYRIASSDGSLTALERAESFGPSGPIGSPRKHFMRASISIARGPESYLVGYTYTPLTEELQPTLRTRRIDRKTLRWVDGPATDVIGTLDVKGWRSLRVAHDGRSFLAAWRDTRGGIYGTQLTSDGAPDRSAAKPDGIPLDLSATNAVDDRAPWTDSSFALAGTSNGRSILLSSYFRQAEQSTRTRARWLEERLTTIPGHSDGGGLATDMGADPAASTGDASMGTTIGDAGVDDARALPEPVLDASARSSEKARESSSCALDATAAMDGSRSSSPFAALAFVWLALCGRRRGQGRSSACRVGPVLPGG